MIVIPARIIVLTFLFALPVLAQTELTVLGNVATTDGQPVAGATVYVSMSKKCCPVKREQTTTNPEGQFRLEQPGAVIHFYKDGFQPKALVVAPTSAPIQVVLKSATNALSMPVCGRPEPGRKRIGWGNYGLHFDAPKRAVEIFGGKLDVDYVRYVIRRKGGAGSLVLWFGGNAAPVDAHDELFINSTDFDQRNVVAIDGSVVGRDSWGHLRSGGNWRHTAVAFEGAAIYEDVIPEDSNFFDSVINSICQVPDRKR